MTELNPYMTPEAEELLTIEENNTGKALPTFVKGWAITDLCFCLLRGLLTFFSIIGLAVLHSQGKLNPGFILEFIANGGIFLFGTIANILILMKKPLGYNLGMISCFTVLLSVISSIITIFYNYTESDVAEPGFLIGAVVGLVISLSIRFILLVFYVSALKKFKVFCQ